MKIKRKIYVRAIRNYYNNDNEKRPGFMYPLIAHQVNGEKILYSTNHDMLFRRIKSYISVHASEIFSEEDVKKTFKYLMNKEKWFYIYKNDGGNDIYRPSIEFLEFKTFWTTANIALIISIISIILWGLTLMKKTVINIPETPLNVTTNIPETPVNVTVNVPETPVIINIPKE